ncbi:MAG TPA: hypothetical protein PLV62_12860 [Spirochaetota bacterium]|nr:hypothetical protein [Spirochaetota bacterium]HPK45865.1 hypothetical protein [Spirochaetota bacterium]
MQPKNLFVYKEDSLLSLRMTDGTIIFSYLMGVHKPAMGNSSENRIMHLNVIPGLTQNQHV